MNEQITIKLNVDADDAIKKLNEIKRLLDSIFERTSIVIAPEINVMESKADVIKNISKTIEEQIKRKDHEIFKL